MLNRTLLSGIMEKSHNTKEPTAAAVGGKSHSVKKAKYTKILKDRGYRQYEPLEFYRELFPLGELAEYDPDPKHRNNENYEYISVIQERTNKTICYKDKRTNEFRTAKQSKRHVVCDETLFNEVKDSITFNGEPVTYTEKNGQIYFELKNITARNLSTQYVLQIGENEYRYAVLDYVKACLESPNVSEQTRDLVMATYRYNEAAKAYFE